MSIKLGIVGAGAIGNVHAEAAKAVGLEIAGIADIDIDHAKKLSDDLGGVWCVQDAGELFDKSDIDAVVIGVPNRDHKDLAISAMRAGKDVLLEKPMGLNASECREINGVAGATGRVLQIGFVHRFSSVGKSAKQIIDTGELGKIYHVKAQLSRRRGIPGLGGWFTTKAESGGGPLIDVGVHVVDLALYLLGNRRPARVSGKAFAHFGSPIEDYVYESMWAGPPKPEGVFDVEDEAHALIHLDDGTVLSLDVAWAINTPAGSVPENMMGFYGDKGGMSFELFGDHLNLATEVHKHNSDSKVFLPEVKLYEEQITDFARAVEVRGRPCATGEQGEVVQSVIDAIYESSETDREVLIRMAPNETPSGRANTRQQTNATAGHAG